MFIRESPFRSLGPRMCARTDFYVMQYGQSQSGDRRERESGVNFERALLTAAAVLRCTSEKVTRCDHSVHALSCQ